MFTGNFFGARYFAPRYFPRNFILAPTSTGGASGGRPWPQKLVNLLNPIPVMLDDDDFLLIFD